MFAIEKARSTDLPELLELEERSFTNPWSEEKFLGSFPHFSVARLDGKIVGFIGIEMITDEAHILHMAVHPDLRRQGIAKKLMEFALSYPANKWFLEVRATNLPAQKLYESYGFSIINRRDKYYQDNDEDALIMSYQRPN